MFTFSAPELAVYSTRLASYGKQNCSQLFSDRQGHRSCLPHPWQKAGLIALYQVRTCDWISSGTHSVHINYKALFQVKIFLDSQLLQSATSERVDSHAKHVALEFMPHKKGQRGETSTPIKFVDSVIHAVYLYR